MNGLISLYTVLNVYVSDVLIGMCVQCTLPKKIQPL